MGSEMCIRDRCSFAPPPCQRKAANGSSQRGPSRAREADARKKQQRRAAATAHKLPLSRPALRRSTNADRMPARGGEEVIIDDFKSSGARSRVPSRFRDRQPGERPRASSRERRSVGGRPRPTGVSTTSSRGTYRMGETVEARYKNGSQYYNCLLYTSDAADE